jgi:hypothetical protein
VLTSVVRWWVRERPLLAAACQGQACAVVGRMGFPITVGTISHDALQNINSFPSSYTFLPFCITISINNHGWYPPSRLGRRSQVVHSCSQSSRPTQCAFQQPIARRPA